jgi:hypothetical protein
MICFAALMGIILWGCDFENGALDENSEDGGLRPIPPRYQFARYSNNLSADGVTAHGCCGKSPANNADGDVDYAINGNTGNWWHTNWGMTLATSDGHTGDATALTLLDGTATTVGAHVTGNTPRGIHWITLDLGKEVSNVDRLGYRRRSNGGNGDFYANGPATYEVWIDTQDIGWDVSHATLAKAGSFNQTDDYVYAEFTPQPLRYIQLRWRFTGTSGDKYASAANLTLGVVTPTSRPEGFDGIDFSYLIDAYNTAYQKLRDMDISSAQYPLYVSKVNAAKEYIKNAQLGGLSVLQEIEKQAEIDNLAKSLWDMVYTYFPPKAPPEVE